MDVLVVIALPPQDGMAGLMPVGEQLESWLSLGWQGRQLVIGDTTIHRPGLRPGHHVPGRGGRRCLAVHLCHDLASSPCASRLKARNLHSWP